MSSCLLTALLLAKLTKILFWISNIYFPTFYPFSKISTMKSPLIIWATIISWNLGCLTLIYNALLNWIHRKRYPFYLSFIIWLAFENRCHLRLCLSNTLCFKLLHLTSNLILHLLWYQIFYDFLKILHIISWHR